MGRDFSPREHWMANLQFPDLYFSNIKWVIGEKTTYMFTEQEMEDRKAHPYIAVLGSDIFKELRDILTKEQFESLNSILKEVVDIDFGSKEKKEFPEPILCWYYNKHNHHYHEPNDEEFMEYIKTVYAKDTIKK